MPISARTSQSLHNTLGDDAAEDVVNWMNQMEMVRTELRELNMNQSRFALRMDARFSEADVRLELRLTEFRRALGGDLEVFRKEMRADMAMLRLDLMTAIGTFDAKLERRFADLLKWSFVFWVGAVGAVAILAKALR